MGLDNIVHAEFTRTAALRTKILGTEISVASCRRQLKVRKRPVLEVKLTGQRVESKELTKERFWANIRAGGSDIRISSQRLKFG